jgi:hypothetical protein
MDKAVARRVELNAMDDELRDFLKLEFTSDDDFIAARRSGRSVEDAGKRPAETGWSRGLNAGMKTRGVRGGGASACDITLVAGDGDGISVSRLSSSGSTKRSAPSKDGDEWDSYEIRVRKKSA